MALGKNIGPGQGETTTGRTTTTLNGKAEIRPETVRFLAEKAARIDALLVEVSSKISGSNVGGHADRMRRVEIWFEADVKKLFGG